MTSRLISCILFFALFGLSFHLARGQTKPTSQPLKTFAIQYEPGPKWVKDRSIFEQNLFDHGNYMQKLLDEKKLQMGGPFSDSSGGMAIIEVADQDAADQIMKIDPAIKSGVFVAKVRPWYVVFRAVAR